ncbi:MAG: class I SAM-dependent methyltransferase [Roseburia sp.]|nr:class I SAM-dependent methyltransferase [Anaeroplasma bactoclasticum]MCM1196402.1 class I SAM-dependent methyltransferase [Roseburia sp.]MCM1556330.1 class I SAM-dependent methyltransferase [Anaeroplasma bactoclasticum]
MSEINDKEVVQNQYKTATNLNTRKSIHNKYSVNKQGFGNWITSYYHITEGMRVLELGCGTGDMWKNNISLLSKCSELVLTDISEGMIETARNKIGNIHNVAYQVVDIQDIPFESNSFDIVIANMMLYHVPDLKKGLSEVKRVLKDGGSFYCATYGEHGIVHYIANLLKPYGVEERVNKNFTLQNGKQILEQYFMSIEMQEYIDALEVTNIEDMLDYIDSLPSITSISNLKRDVIRKVLGQNKVDGILKVPKEYGIFICK